MLLAVLWSGAAHAEISTFSIFPTRGFQTGGSTTNGGNILGNTPAEATFNAGGTVLLVFDEDITTHTFTITATGTTGGTATVDVRFLNTSPVGAPLNFTDTAAAGLFPGSAPGFDVQLAIDGPGEFIVPSGVFNSACDGIGGCNSVLLNVGAAAGFTASAVSSAPEPASWMLMIFGFTGIAARLKSLRARDRLGFSGRGQNQRAKKSAHDLAHAVAQGTA